MISWVGLIARRLAWPVFITVVVVAVFGFGVIPTRTYLDRRQQVTAAEQRLEAVREANDEDKRRIERLGTDAEIERLAREHYGLVHRGEEPYKIVPPPQPPVDIPDVWPFDRLHPDPG